MKRNLLLTLTAILLINGNCSSPSSSAILKEKNELLANFNNPPNEARPRVWWHWMNGNVTQNGIQKDLEWMERIGIGGFHNFDANLFTPPVTEKKLVFMTPEWKAAFKFTADLAVEKGMEMTIAGSPGWSVTGGPWVEPADAMKKYVWTETRVKGGQTFEGKLPRPSDIVGKFQNIPLQEGGFSGAFVGEKPVFYADARVVAYPEQEVPLSVLNPKVRASGGSFTLKDLTDGDLHKSIFLPPRAVGEDMWIQYEFPSPQTFKAFSVVGANTSPLGEFNGNPENRSLRVSDDGVNFREIAKVSGSTVPQNTVSFAPTSAKYWRMAWETLPPPFNPFIAMLGIPMEPAKPDGINVAEFVLYSTDRIDQFEDKAGFSPWTETTASYLAPGADAIAKPQILDLTDRMQPDGSLKWEAPEGNWVILRLGYSLTGRQNHPASPEATGLEVDKLDPDAVRKYINHYLDLYRDATGGVMGEKGLQYVILDSYEAGHMTWTKSFPEAFETRRGYNIIPWIPVLTGRIVESREASERFLWDFRKTIGEMIAENHYDVIGEELHKRGMKRYTESHENKRIYLADGMDVKRNADIPMAAMWTPGSLAGGDSEEVRSEADIRESASVAHVYGKRFVAAESMTSVGRPFIHTPEKLKRTADLEMASGLNRFVIHTSVHQPLDDKMPGFSLGPFGQYFTRQETWAEQARPWIDYLARSCYLLQQGQFVADALVYYGENTNLTWAFRESLPQIQGYEYDFVNARALMDVVKFENGKITTPGGGLYSVLVLHESAREMTLPVLKKLKQLLDAGAKVSGTLPEKSPTLADDPTEVQKIITEIRSHKNVSSQTAEEVLKAQGVEKDVIFGDPQAEILSVHRKTSFSDIYWLDSRSSEDNSAEISFRVSGKVPELWHPETGKVEKVSWKIEGGRTVIPLEFDPWEAVFIVFAEKTDQQSFTLPETTVEERATLSGPWQVSFPNGRGAPAQATFPALASWTENEVPGIKYFSGTATYSQTFDLKTKKEGSRIILDLGAVKDLAEITVNDQNLGILWKTPFKMDITDAVKTGSNELKIAVTNVWANRLIGDAQPDTPEKITFTTMPFYRADGQLLPSGLLGEVRVWEVF
ncbi:MAG: glycosyl hydrolase [Bacteroidia bacterium]|nr:glycosyl hydrolase [Bacteroidia bacterium]